MLELVGRSPQIRVQCYGVFDERGRIPPRTRHGGVGSGDGHGICAIHENVAIYATHESHGNHDYDGLKYRLLVVVDGEVNVNASESIGGCSGR